MRPSGTVAERKTSSMTALSKKYRYNAEPRLSANQLAEYLKATSARRKGIIKDAKFPRTAVVTQYRHAREGISKFVCSDIRDQKILVSAISSLTDKEADEDATGWTRDDARRSIEAIQTFQKSMNAMGIDKLDCKRVAGNQPPLMIQGVTISVNLDATTHRLVKANDAVGGVSFLFSKAETSGTARADRSKVAAVLALLFAQEHLGYLGVADPTICFSFDVMAGKAYPAPKTYKTLLTNMEAACEEVALRWSITAAPADYDGPPWQ